MNRPRNSLGQYEPSDRRRKKLVIRCRLEDLERWQAAAANEEGPLAALARELLDAWAEGVETEG